MDFCLKKKINAVQVNQFGRDVEIFTHKKFNIDVKTSHKVKNWTNKKYRPYVSYDVVYIDENDNSIYLYPDLNSPLRELYYGHKIANLDKAYKDYKCRPSFTKIQFNPIKNFKSMILKQSTKKKIRFVYRVITHEWKGYADNIPGKNWKNFEATIFFNLNFDWINDTPILDKAYVFISNEMNEYPLQDAEKRQLNKGIETVLNWELFEKNYPNRIFSSLDELIDFFS